MQLIKSTTNNNKYPNYFTNQYLLVYLEENQKVSKIFDSAEEAFCEYEGLEQEENQPNSKISKVHLYFL